MRLHLFLCISATEKVVLCSRQCARSGLYAVGVLVAWSMSDIWEKTCGDFGLSWLMFPNENQIFKSDIHVLPLIGSAPSRPILLFLICPCCHADSHVIGWSAASIRTIIKFSHKNTHTNRHCCFLLSFSHSCQFSHQGPEDKNDKRSKTVETFDEFRVWVELIILENVWGSLPAFSCDISFCFFRQNVLYYLCIIYELLVTKRTLFALCFNIFWNSADSWLFLSDTRCKPYFHI